MSSKQPKSSKKDQSSSKPTKSTTTDDIPSHPHPLTTTATSAASNVQNGLRNGPNPARRSRTAQRNVKFKDRSAPHSDASDDEAGGNYEPSASSQDARKSGRKTAIKDKPLPSSQDGDLPSSPSSDTAGDSSEGSFMTSDSEYDDVHPLSHSHHTHPLTDPFSNDPSASLHHRQQILSTQHDAQLIAIPPITHEQLSELPVDFYNKYYNCSTPSDFKYSDYLEEYVNHCYYCTSPGCLPYHVDILRNLSIRGYINSYHRRRIWPLLLGVMREDIDLYYTRFINPDHLMYDQLNKDILRSCNHLDVHLENSQDVIENNRQYCAKILHSLFAKYDSNLISYCQGFHDIAVVCLTICGVAPPEDTILNEISKLGSDLLVQNKSYSNDYANSLTGSQSSRSNSTLSTLGVASLGSGGGSVLGVKSGGDIRTSLSSLTNSSQSSHLTSSTIHDSLNSASTDSAYLNRTKRTNKKSSKNNKDNDVYYSNSSRHRRHIQIQSAIQKATTETLQNIKANSNDALAYALVEKLALTSMNQTLQTSLQSVQNLISIVPTILHPFVPEFASILSQIPLIYSLSWFLTWFSHSTVKINLISRMFDFLLASNPLICVQVSSAVLITHAPRIKLQLQIAKKERIIMEYGCEPDDVEKITESQLQESGQDAIINELDMVAIIQYFQKCDLVMDIDAVINIATALWSLSSQRLIHVEESITKPIANQDNYLHFSQHTGDYYFSNQFNAYRKESSEEKEALFNYFNLKQHYSLQKSTYPLDLSLFGLLKLPIVLAKWLKRPRIVNILSLRMALQHLLLANGLSHHQFYLPSWKPLSTYGLLDIDQELHQLDPDLILIDEDGEIDEQTSPDVVCRHDRNNQHQQHQHQHQQIETGHGARSGPGSLRTTVGTNLVSDIISLCGDLNDISSITSFKGQKGSKSSQSTSFQSKSALEKCNVQQILTPNSTLLITHSFLYYCFRPNSLALDPVVASDPTQSLPLPLNTHPQAGGKLNNAISVWKTPDGAPLKQLGSCAIFLPTISVHCLVGHSSVNKLVEEFEGNEGAEAAEGAEGEVATNGEAQSTTKPTFNSQPTVTLQTNPLEIAAFVNLQYIMEPPTIIKPAHAKQQETIVFDIFGGRGILEKQAQLPQLKSLFESSRNEKEVTKAAGTLPSATATWIDLDDIDEHSSTTLGTNATDLTQTNLPHHVDHGNESEEAKYQRAAQETKQLRGLDKFRAKSGENGREGEAKKGVSFPSATDDLQTSYEVPNPSENRSKRREAERLRLEARKKWIESKLTRNNELFQQKMRQELLAQADRDREMDYQLNDEDGNVIIRDEAERISLLLNPAAAAAVDSDLKDEHATTYKKNPTTFSLTSDTDNDTNQSKVKAKQTKPLPFSLNPPENPTKDAKHVQIVIIDGQTRVIHMNDQGTETTSYFALHNDASNSNPPQSHQQPVDLEQGDVSIPNINPLDEIAANDDQAAQNRNRNRNQNQNQNQEDHADDEDVQFPNHFNPFDRSILEQDVTDIGFDTNVDALVDKRNEYEIENDPQIQQWWAQENLKREIFGSLSDAEILALQEFQQHSRDHDVDYDNGEIDNSDNQLPHHAQQHTLKNPHVSTLHDIINDSSTYHELTNKTAHNINIPVKTKHGDIIQINPTKIPYSTGLKQYIIDPDKFQQLLDSTPMTINNMPVSMFLKIREKKKQLEEKYKSQLQQEQQQYNIWRITQQQQEQEQILQQQLRYEQQQLMLLDVKTKELSIEIDRLNDIDVNNNVPSNQQHENDTLIKRRARMQKKLYQDQRAQHGVLQQQHFQRVLFLQEEQQRLEFYHQNEINRILQLNANTAFDGPITAPEGYSNDHIGNVGASTESNDQNYDQTNSTKLTNSAIVVPVASLTVNSKLIPNKQQSDQKKLEAEPVLTSDSIMHRSALTSLPPQLQTDHQSSTIPTTIQHQITLTSDLRSKLVQPELHSDADSDEIVEHMKKVMDNANPLTPNQIATVQPYMKHYDTTTTAIADRLGLPAPNNTNRLAILKAKIQQKKQKEDVLRSQSFLYGSISDYFNSNSTSNPYSESNMSLFAQDMSENGTLMKNGEINEAEFDKRHKPKGWLSTIGSAITSTISTILTSPLDIFTDDSDSDDEYGYNYGSHHNYASEHSTSVSGITNDDDYMYSDPNIRRRIRNERKAILFEKEQMQILQQNIPYLPLSQQQQQYKAIILNAALLRLGYPIIQPQTEEQQESFYWGQLINHTDPLIIKRLNQITHKSQRLQYAADKLTEYLLIVLDNLNIHQIKPEIHNISDDSKRLYNIHTAADAQKQYMYDCDISKLILLQLIGQLGWILKQEDTVWVQEHEAVLSQHHKNALAAYEGNQLGIGPTSPNDVNTGLKIDHTLPPTHPTSSFPIKDHSIPSLIPALTSTQQPLIPLFPEVRKYIITQLHKKDQIALKEGSKTHPTNSLLDYNMMTDNELRSLIAQHHYQIKIIDAYTGSGENGNVNPISIPRLPRYSVEWVEYQRQVQERLLLQRKEWLLKGYSEKKIKRLSKIEKRRLIFGNLAGNGDENNIGEYGQDLDSEQHHDGGDKMSLSMRKADKVNRRLAKAALYGDDPTEADSTDSDHADDEQRVNVYNRKDVQNQRNTRAMFQTSQRKLLKLSLSPQTVLQKSSAADLGIESNRNNGALMNLGLEKDLKVADAYYHSIDIPLFSFRLTKEQRRQQLLIRRAELISSSSPSTTDTSDDEDQDNYGLPPRFNPQPSDTIRRLDPIDPSFQDNQFAQYLHKKRKKAMRRTIIDDVSRIIAYQKKQQYKKSQEEKRIKMLRKQYRAELRLQRQHVKAAEKMKRIQQGMSIYDMLTSSTSTDYYSSSSSGGGSLFGGESSEPSSGFTTTQSSSTDDEEEQSQVEIVREVLSLQKLNQDDPNRALKLSKHLKKQKSRNKILSQSGGNDENAIDPLKHHHQQKVLSQLEQKQLLLLEKKYTRQARQRQFILTTPLTPVSFDTTNNINNPASHTSALQMVKNPHSSTTNCILRALLQVCAYPFAVLTQPVDRHIESIAHLGVDADQVSKSTQLPSMTSVQKQLEMPMNLANNSGNTSLSNDTNVEYSYSILTDIAPAINVISSANTYTSDIYRRKFTINNVKMSPEVKRPLPQLQESAEKDPKTATLKKRLPAIGSRPTDPSTAILTTREQEANGITVAATRQGHTIFVPTLFDYYTHIKRISHVHSCSCKYQYDMINTRKSILYYSKIMSAQLLIGSITTWGISSFFSILEYFFPRSHGTQHWWKALAITMLTDLYTLSCNTSRYATPPPPTHSSDALDNEDEDTNHLVEYDPKTIIYTKYHNKSPRLSIRYPLPPSILWVPSVTHLCMLNEFNIFSMYLSSQHIDKINTEQVNQTNGNGIGNINKILTSDGVLNYPDHCCDCEEVDGQSQLCIHKQQRNIQKAQLSRQYQSNAKNYVSLYTPVPRTEPPPDPTTQSPQSELDTPTSINSEPAHTPSALSPVPDQPDNSPLCVCDSVTFQHYFLTPSEHVTTKPISSILPTHPKQHPKATNPTNSQENANLANIPNTSTLDLPTAALGPTNLPTSPSQIIAHAIGTLIPHSPTALLFYSVGLVVVVSGVVEFFRR